MLEARVRREGLKESTVLLVGARTLLQMDGREQEERRREKPPPRVRAKRRARWRWGMGLAGCLHVRLNYLAMRGCWGMQQGRAQRTAM